MRRDSALNHPRRRSRRSAVVVGETIYCPRDESKISHVAERYHRDTQ